MPAPLRMLLLVLLTAPGACAAPAVSTNFLGRRMEMKSSQVHALPSDIRALAGATEDINSMDHNIKSLLGTFDTFLCMFLLPFLAPFVCMFFAMKGEKDVDGRGLPGEEEVSLLCDESDGAVGGRGAEEVSLLCDESDGAVGGRG